MRDGRWRRERSKGSLRNQVVNPESAEATLLSMERIAIVAVLPIMAATVLCTNCEEGEDEGGEELKEKENFVKDNFNVLFC